MVDRVPLGQGYRLQVAELRKNARECLRVELHDFKGYDLLSLRIWVEPSNGTAEGLVPSSKGIAVSVSMIPLLRAALENAERLAVAQGILPAAQDEHGLAPPCREATLGVAGHPVSQMISA